jgi:ankyrin repeat protein
MLTILVQLSSRFRWAVCQLEILRHCFPPSIRHVLSELPESLDETYERILSNIPRSYRNHAHRLFQCLVVAMRPLRVTELAEVLAVDFEGDGQIPILNEAWRFADPVYGVLSSCSSLITVVEHGDSPVVQFSHFSVKEFLTSDRLATSSYGLTYHHISLELAHATMLQACLSVLLRLDFHIDGDGIKNFPLAEYAAQHWTDHAEFGDVLSHVQDGVGRFLDADLPHFAAWLWLRNISWTAERHPTPLDRAPLLYLADLGFFDLVQHFIPKRRQDVHAKDRHGRTILHLAASGGHLDVARILIECGADVKVADDAGETPLHGTMEYIDYKLADTYFDAIQFLLEQGADVDAQNHAHSTPLHRASYYGSPKAAQLLLRFGANVQVRNNEGRTPLHYALRPDVVQLLLEHNADSGAQDDDGSTILHVASSEGKLEVIQLLLKYGANVHARNKNGQTPLEVASARGHQEIVGILSGHVPGKAPGSGKETCSLQ